MDRVAEFLKVAENVGIDKGDIPDLTKVHHSATRKLDQMIPLWLFRPDAFRSTVSTLEKFDGNGQICQDLPFSVEVFQ